MYKIIFKPFFDFLISLTILLAISPLFLIITIVLMLYYKGNPFFTQERPGKNEKIFNIMKFRTMTDKTDRGGKLLPDADRLTNFGNFLRKTSLDEIPQLLNIIKGQMSLIGPRPLRVRYLPYYTEKEQLRHTIRPGITGLAQISGRNFLPWDDRLKKDIEYVEKLSFRLDAFIFIKTISKVLSSKDVAIDSDSGMIDFDELRNNTEQLTKR